MHEVFDLHRVPEASVWLFLGVVEAPSLRGQRLAPPKVNTIAAQMTFPHPAAMT